MPSEEKNDLKTRLETLCECIDLMFWGVFYRRVYRPDVKCELFIEVTLNAIMGSKTS